MPGSGRPGADVLVVSPRVPEFDRASGWLRLYLLLQMLAKKYRVRFLGRTDGADAGSLRYVTSLQDMGIEVHLAPQVDVTTIVDDVKLFVFFEFYTTAERALARVRMRRPDLPVIVDSVDIHFVREFRALRYAPSSWRATLRARKTRRRELGVYRKADMIVTVSENDRAELLRALPEARVTVIPNIHLGRESIPGFHERRRNSLLFVGAFAHSPNVDAVLFFCREVLPLVKQTLPDVEVTIVGSKPPREIQDLARSGVIVAGWVPELSSLLDSHCVSIAPLRFGAGIKGKIGEALAAGLPVVTTSVGAEGMGLEHEETAMIADSAPTFADAVVRLCSDPSLHQRLSKSGQLHALRHWGVVPVGRQLTETIEGIRHLKPKSLGNTELRYLCLRRRIARAQSVTAWYGRQVLRRFGER